MNSQIWRKKSYVPFLANNMGQSWHPVLDLPATNGGAAITAEVVEVITLFLKSWVRDDAAWWSQQHPLDFCGKRARYSTKMRQEVRLRWVWLHDCFGHEMLSVGTILYSPGSPNGLSCHILTRTTEVCPPNGFHKKESPYAKRIRWTNLRFLANLRCLEPNLGSNKCSQYFPPMARVSLVSPPW